MQGETKVLDTRDDVTNIINTVSCLNWLRLLCFDHNLHLAVMKAINSNFQCTRALGLSQKIRS